MKYTLLELTQNILESMSSDEVNSINDTSESRQVALICKTAFYDIASELNLPEHFDVYELQASGDSGKPTIMYRPDTAHNLIWLKYNVRTIADDADDWLAMSYLPINDFFNYIHNLRTNQDNVIAYTHLVNGDSITLYARDDHAPQFYSSFDDNTIVFDAYDAAVDSTLQKTKTLGFGGMSKIFSMEDDFIPPLDEQVFSLYYNECKSIAWAELKETPNMMSERAAKRQRTSLQRDKTAFGDVLSRFDRLPNFGRNGRWGSTLTTIPRILRNGS